MRTVIARVSLATLVLVASPAWAQKPKGKPPAGKPKQAPVPTRVLVASSVPVPLPVSGVIPLERGSVWAVVAGLQSGTKALPPDLPVQLLVERAPWKFEKVAEARLDPRTSAATLRWKVGPAFPAGAHRWYVLFPRAKNLLPSRTAWGVFFVGSPTRVVVASTAPAPPADGEAIPLARGATWTVVASLQSDLKSLPPNLPLQLFVERQAGKFSKVAEAKLDGRASATLRWKVGPAFPAGSHRWYVLFPGAKDLTPSSTAAGEFVVASP